MGGCGVCLSSQLGHLPDTGGGPWRPRRQEEPLSDQVECGGEWGGRTNGGQTGPAPLRGGREKGGVPWPGGTLGGSEDQGRHGGCFPHPLRTREACWAPRPGPPPSKATSGHKGSRGVGGRDEGGRGGEADMGDPLGSEDQGECT